MADFLDYYSQNPWSSLELNQRTWYVPTLLSLWQKQSIYRSYVPTSVDLQAQRTQKMVFNLVMDYEPNTNPVDPRLMWFESMYTDSMQLEITTEHHVGRISLHKYDDLITYWQETGGQAGLQPIIERRLAPSMVTHLDRLARNAFLQSPWQNYAMDPAKQSAADLTPDDVFLLDWIDMLQLQFANLNAPGFDGTPGSFIVITTPGTLYDIKHAAGNEFVDTFKYTELGIQKIVNGEVGYYRGARFVITNDAYLFNSGPITTQKLITAQPMRGDGATANWKGYNVGQPSSIRYIQLDSLAAGEFNVGDKVTIHKARTSNLGVLDGVDPFDGMTFERIVTDVDTANARISVDKPILWDFNEVIDTGPPSVYGYVTKGLHIGTSTFIAMPGAVVLGVTQPPMVHRPPTIDDAMAQYRMTWDGYVKYQQFRTELAVPIFHSTKFAYDGKLQTGA